MSGTAGQGSRGQSRPVILSVDDRPANLLAVSTLLKELDAEVVEASSGQQALEIALARDDISVILLDVQMPGMNGFETAETLRRMESTKHVPILFVTANSTEAEHIFQGYEAGAVDYLPKPIPGHILTSKVRVFLDMAAQRQRLVDVVGDLKESRKELKRSNAALQEFAHAAAHDLKAPIRHIAAWVDMLREDEGEELKPGTISMLDRIEKSAQRMHDLVDGMLTFATLDARAPVLEKVDLNEVLASVIDEFSDTISDCNATIELEKLPSVMGHSGLLLRLFQNLISNCLKYRRLDVDLEVTVSAGELPRTQASTCQFFIQVKDNGSGFSQEHADLIFQPFKRLVGSSIEGSGIGMASASKIAQLHGGDISAQGQVDKGATFTVRLPRAE